MTSKMNMWKCAVTCWPAHSARVFACSFEYLTRAFAPSSLFNPCARTCAFHFRTPSRTARLLPVRLVGKILKNLLFYVLMNPPKKWFTNIADMIMLLLYANAPSALSTLFGRFWVVLPPRRSQSKKKKLLECGRSCFLYVQQWVP